MNVGIPPVILKAARKHTASLVFLHGLGDTGLGWAGALNSIKPDYLKAEYVHLGVEDWSEVLLRQQSYAIKNQLGHLKPPTRGILLAPRWFFMA